MKIYAEKKILRDHKAYESLICTAQDNTPANVCLTQRLHYGNNKGNNTAQ